MTATMLLVVGLVGIFAAIMLSLTAVGVFDNEARGVGKSLSVLEAYSAAPPELRKELEDHNHRYYDWYGYRDCHGDYF